MCKNKAELEANLKLIEAELERLRAKLARSRLTLNEHCSEQVRRVDLYIETEIERLNGLRKKWLQEIKEYEAKCVEDMEATKSELEASLEKTKQWVQSIRDFRNTEKYLSELSQQSEDHLSKLKALLLEIEGFRFGGELLQFYEGYRCCDFDEDARPCLMSHKLRIPQSIETYFTNKYSTISSWSSLWSSYCSRYFN
jgi:ABC-type phosphate transport system auxiliary subunit